MTTIQFYHLTATPLERALPKLLEKCVSGGFVTQVIAGSDDQVEHLNQLLWTYDPNSFLPHGSAKDGYVSQQPVLLATQVEAENPASILVVTDGSTPEVDRFERVLDMFDGSNPQAVEDARKRWAHYKSAGLSLTYMQQTEQGGWAARSGG